MRVWRCGRNKRLTFSYSAEAVVVATAQPHLLRPLLMHCTCCTPSCCNAEAQQQAAIVVSILVPYDSHILTLSPLMPLPSFCVAEAQQQAVVAFFRQNGWVGYDTLSKLVLQGGKCGEVWGGSVGHENLSKLVLRGGKCGKVCGEVVQGGER